MKQKRLWVTIATFILTMFNASPAFARQINENFINFLLFLLFLLYILPFVLSMFITPKPTQKKMFIVNVVIYGISFFICVFESRYSNNPYDPPEIAHMERPLFEVILGLSVFGVILPYVLILVALIIRMFKKKDNDSSNRFKA